MVCKLIQPDNYQRSDTSYELLKNLYLNGMVMEEWISGTDSSIDQNNMKKRNNRMLFSQKMILTCLFITAMFDHLVLAWVIS